MNIGYLNSNGVYAVAEQWFYETDGRKHGPVWGHVLKHLAMSGQLKESDMVWKDGLKEWVLAKQVRGLFGVDLESPPLAKASQSASPPIVTDQSILQPQSVPSYQPGFIYCRTCGGNMPQTAAFCIKCGTAVTPLRGTESKSRLTYVLLGLFLGWFGVHNFYAGFTTRAVVQLLITVLVGWTLVPLIPLSIWNLIEVCTVNRDSNGHVFA